MKNQSRRSSTGILGFVESFVGNGTVKVVLLHRWVELDKGLSDVLYCRSFLEVILTRKREHHSQANDTASP